MLMLAIHLTQSIGVMFNSASFIRPSNAQSCSKVRWSRRQNLRYFYGELSLDMTFHVKPNMDFELFRLETPIAVTFVHGDDLCPLATLLWAVADFTIISINIFEKLVKQYTQHNST